MSHDFKSNFSPYTQAHIITGSPRSIYSENLLKILAKNELLAKKRRFFNPAAALTIYGLYHIP